MAWTHHRTNSSNAFLNKKINQQFAYVLIINPKDAGKSTGEFERQPLLHKSIDSEFKPDRSAIGLNLVQGIKPKIHPGEFFTVKEENISGGILKSAESFAAIVKDQASDLDCWDVVRLQDEVSEWE